MKFVSGVIMKRKIQIPHSFYVRLNGEILEVEKKVNHVKLHRTFNYCFFFNRDIEIGHEKLFGWANPEKCFH
jgi:hypothetical protein